MDNVFLPRYRYDTTRVAGTVGLEPTTLRLTAACSSIELRPQDFKSAVHLTPLPLLLLYSRASTTGFNGHYPLTPELVRHPLGFVAPIKYLVFNVRRPGIRFSGCLARKMTLNPRRPLSDVFFSRGFPLSTITGGLQNQPTQPSQVLTTRVSRPI